MSIDDLLSQPLPAVADNGFSARVMKRVRAENSWSVMAVTAVSVAAAASVAALVPLPTLLLDLNTVLVELFTSPMVGAGASALVLTFLIERGLFRSEA